MMVLVCEEVCYVGNGWALTIFRSDLQVLIKVALADEVNDDVYTLAVGELLDLFGEVLGFVVDACCCSEGLSAEVELLLR